MMINYERYVELIHWPPKWLLYYFELKHIIVSTGCFTRLNWSTAYYTHAITLPPIPQIYRTPPISQIYRQYGIKVALIGMQSWRTQDLIKVLPSPPDTLKNFNIYRQEKLLNIYPQHDVSVLMTWVNYVWGRDSYFYKGAIGLYIINKPGFI